MAMVKKRNPSSPSASMAPPPSSEWPDQAVAILLKTYSEKFSVDRGYLRTSDWEEVARNVNTSCHDLKTLKTIKQCRDKIDSLKRRYKMEKLKAVNGGEVSWPFFHRLDTIMNSMLKQNSKGHHVHPHQKYLGGVPFLQGALVEHDDNAQELQQVDEKLECTDSHDDIPTSSDSTSYSEEDDRVAAADRLNDLSEDGLRPYPLPRNHRYLLNGNRDHHHLHMQQFHRYRPYQQDQYHHPPQHGFRDPHHHPHHHRFPLFASPKTYSFVGATQESTEDSGHGKAETASRAPKRKLESENGMVALANAVTGLSKPGLPEVFARIEETKMNIIAKMNLEIAKLEKQAQKSRNKRPSSTSTGP